MQASTPPIETDLAVQRRIVDAFLAASRSGDFEALLEVLDPDVVFRADAGAAGVPSATVRGARAVADRVLSRGSPLAPLARPVVVNGVAGLVLGERDHPRAVVAFTIARDRIIAIDLIVRPPPVLGLDG